MSSGVTNDFIRKETKGSKFPGSNASRNTSSKQSNFRSQSGSFKLRAASFIGSFSNKQIKQNKMPYSLGMKRLNDTKSPKLR